MNIRQSAKYSSIYLIIPLIISLSLLSSVIAEGSEQDAVLKRLAPIATVRIAKQKKAAEKVSSLKSGSQIIIESCGACHNSGAAGAPKIGDQAVWRARLSSGLDTMLNIVINGKGAMPARGGNSALTDDELKDAIIQMLKDSGVDPQASSAQETEPSNREDDNKADSGSGVEGSEMQSESASNTSAPVQEQSEPETKAAETDLTVGKSVYMKGCVTCHDQGIAGAPKVGDKAAWVGRIDQGEDVLFDNAINGFKGQDGYMPAKGGLSMLSDDDVKSAVSYMLSESK